MRTPTSHAAYADAYADADNAYAVAYADAAEGAAADAAAADAYAAYAAASRRRRRRRRCRRRRRRPASLLSPDGRQAHPVSPRRHNPLHTGNFERGSGKCRTAM